MKKTMSRILLVLATLGSLPTSSEAIPAFARKYGFNCNMCHTAFTRLNDFGQRYRDNGYQIAGQEGGEKSVFDTALPIAMRMTTGATYYSVPQGTTMGFNVIGLDLLAAGVLHKNISFLLIYAPRIDEPAGDYSGVSPGQPGRVESISLVLSNIVQDALNLRIGRFEPSYHPLSSKRKFAISEPYEVYTFQSPNNPSLFEDNQMGVEATGKFPFGLKYGLGAVNGTGGRPDNNTTKDFYVRLSHTIGKGEGQTAGQRIGAFGSIGSAPTKRGDSTFTSPTGETNGTDNRSYYRLGVDGSLNWEMLNLGAMVMKGIDDKAMNVFDPNQKYEYTGGLVELNYVGLVNDHVVATLMYNWVSPPAGDEKRRINAYSAVLRYYLGDWQAVNVAIHGEYTFRRTGNESPLDEHLGLIALDFDF